MLPVSRAWTTVNLTALVVVVSIVVVGMWRGGSTPPVHVELEVDDRVER